MIKRINKNIILKLRAKYLKGGVSEKKDLAEEAGGRGFSNLQMDKKLKEMGYDPKRRKTVIGQIVGGKEIESGDLMKLSAIELTNKYNLSKEKLKDLINKKERIKKRILNTGADTSKYIKEKGAWYGISSKNKGEEAKRRIESIERGSSGKVLGKSIGVGGVEEAVGHFALSNNKSAVNNKRTGLVGSQGGSVTNQLNNAGTNSVGPAMPLAKS